MSVVDAKLMYCCCRGPSRAHSNHSRRDSSCDLAERERGGVRGRQERRFRASTGSNRRAKGVRKTDWSLWDERRRTALLTSKRAGRRQGRRQVFLVGEGLLAEQTVVRKLELYTTAPRQRAGRRGNEEVIRRWRGRGSARTGRRCCVLLSVPKRECRQTYRARQKASKARESKAECGGELERGELSSVSRR